MIDFKYYVVTITAIFAALFAGLILGSTLSTSEAVKSQQESIVKSIRNDLSKLRYELSSKQKQLDELMQYAELSQNWIITGKLEGKTIYVLDLSDFDKNKQSRLINLLNEAGAQVVSIELKVDSTTETTLISDLIRLSFKPEINAAALKSIIKDKGSISGEVGQAQEFLILFSKNNLNLLLSDKNLSEIKHIRAVTDDRASAEMLSKTFSENFVITVYDGDPYDDAAAVLMFYADKGIYGEIDETGIIPEKKE